jgi:hypothetical protein
MPMDSTSRGYYACRGVRDYRNWSRGTQSDHAAGVDSGWVSSTRSDCDRYSGGVAMGIDRSDHIVGWLVFVCGFGYFTKEVEFVHFCPSASRCSLHMQRVSKALSRKQSDGLIIVNPARGNAGFARQFAVGYLWPGVPQPGRLAAVAHPSLCLNIKQRFAGLARVRTF